MKKSVFPVAMCFLVAPLVLGLGCGESNIVPSVGGSSEGARGPTGSGDLECSAAAVQSYFGDTCAAGLGDMLNCWGPSGKCTANVDLAGYDVEFENGAVLEHTYGTDGRSVSARYVNNNNQECGSFQTVGDFTSSDWRIAYTTASGEQFDMRPTGTANDYEIVCANGQTVPLTGAQQEQLQDCAGGDALATCTQPGLGDIDPGDYDDFLDAIGRPCTNNDQCPSGSGVNLVCCNVYGESICYESTICSYL